MITQKEAIATLENVNSGSILETLETIYQQSIATSSVMDEDDEDEDDDDYDDYVDMDFPEEDYGDDVEDI
jgi:hypothetical protein